MNNDELFKLLVLHPVKFSLVISFFVSFFAILPKYILTGVMKKLFSENGCKDYEKVHPLSALVGVVERGVYIISVVVGEPSIVVGWLALKSLQKFSFNNYFNNGNDCYLDPEIRKYNESILAQKKYHLVLIGNGLSLFFGLLGGILTNVYLFSIFSEY